MSKVDLGEYMKFCKDFDIPLSKIKLQEVFKKFCSFSRNLDIEEFKSILGRLGIEMNQQRIKDIKMKLKRLGGGHRGRDNNNEDAYGRGGNDSNAMDYRDNNRNQDS